METCKVCGIKPEGRPEPIADRLFEETCARDGRRNFVLSPQKRVEINLAQTEEFLRKKSFQVKSAGQFGITFEAPEDINACILKSGIMIAQTPPKTDEKFRNNVFEIYKIIMVEGLKFAPSILPEV